MLKTVTQNREIDYLNTIVFSLIAAGTIITVPLYAYYYDFSWLDWTMFFALYIFTGLGITVG